MSTKKNTGVDRNEIPPGWKPKQSEPTREEYDRMWQEAYPASNRVRTY